MFPFAHGIYGSAVSLTPEEILVDTYGADEVWRLVDIAAGTTIPAYVNSARNGTLSGWDLQNTAGSVPGTLAPYSDGSDYGLIYSSNGVDGLVDIFNAAEFSIYIAVKIDVDAYRTAVNRFAIQFKVNNSNRIIIYRLAGVKNTYNFEYIAGGTNKTVQFVARWPDSGWIGFGLSVSKSGDILKAYWDGQQIGATLTGLGTWAGALTATEQQIGARDTGAVNSWKGHFNYYAVSFGGVWSDADHENINALVNPTNKPITDGWRIDNTLSDCEGVALADINGDGRDEILSLNSTTAPAVYWYQRNDSGGKSWTRNTIATSAGTKLEGCCWGDFDGDGEYEAIVADQTQGKIRIYKPSSFGVPAGTWDVAELLTGVPFVHDVVAMDIDGDGRPEIVYAFEGDGAGVGGIGWLDWDNGDVMTPGNWSNYSMIQRDGAWGILSDRLDLAGNGAVDIVFSSRNSGRNASADPGIFWLEKPLDPTGAWAEATIESRTADWTHVDYGDFFGNGNNDFVAIDLAGTHGPTIYDAANSWAATDLAVPNAERQWIIRSIPAGIATSARTEFMIAFSDSAVYRYRYLSGAWAIDALNWGTAGHPLDGGIEWSDVNGDGEPEAIVADSDDNSTLLWIKI